MNVLRALMAGLALLLTNPAAAADTGRFSQWDDGSRTIVDHSAWAAFLKKYVDTTYADGVNRVRYSAVNDEDRRQLADYITALTRLDPVRLGKDEAFAYWVNLYNAVTVKLILDHFPVKSIRDIKPSIFAIGPWKLKLVTVAGERLSLDNIEHDVLRTYWKDPRIHYVVNCASIGCPNLSNRPLTGAGLNAALDRAARDYVNHGRGARFDSRGRLILSSIYKWYAEDFGGSDPAVIAHLTQFAAPPLKQKLSSVRTIARYDYDWSLNGSSKD